MSGLILLCIAFTALVGALCTLIYIQQNESLRHVRQQLQILAAMENALGELGELGERQQVMQKKIDQLATDVLQREIYQSAEDRHQSAIQSAKQGRNLFELMQRHGLSTDEAALISSLHSPEPFAGEPVVKNANLIDPSTVDVL